MSTGEKAGLLRRIERRHAALRLVRAFFEERGFHEVETQMLVPATTTEPHIDPLEVPLRPAPSAAPVVRYLHTSPELALKRVIAGGAERVFQLARVFRDGERGPLHLPEFCLLEWYRAGGTLDDLVADCEALLAAFGETFGQREGLFGPFSRTTVDELFRAHAGVDLRAALVEMEAGDALALVRRAKEAGLSLREGATFDDAFFHVMGTKVEPALAAGPPVVVERWPRQMAVLARLCDDDPLFAARFELYARGVELANAFDELTDPAEQRARFLDDNAARVALGKPALPLDERFLDELSRMPRTAGIALGFDRLLLLAVGGHTLDDVYPLSYR